MQKINLVRLLIAETGLSQRAFAKAVDESPSNISVYVNGKQDISLSKLEKWLDIFGFKLKIITNE